MWRNASAVGNYSERAHSDGAGTQQILFVTSGQTDIDTGSEPEVLPVVHLVLAAKVHVSNARGGSRAGKSSIQTGGRGAAARNDAGVKLVESGASGRKRILIDGSIRSDFQTDVQYWHCNGDVKVAAN